jgi:cytochrome c oxidase subunit 1
MVYCIITIAGLASVVWAHRVVSVFVPTGHPLAEVSSSLFALLLYVPLTLVLVNWLATLWEGQVVLTTPVLFALGAVWLGIVGGLSGIFLAVTPVRELVHGTYLLVGHWHGVLFATAMAAVSAIYFWSPRMFGRALSPTWGQVHFALTFVLANAVLFLMFILAATGFARREVDPYQYATFRGLETMHQYLFACAIGLTVVQGIFVVNFLTGLFAGQPATGPPRPSETAGSAPPDSGDFRSHGAS